jgi:16S rRNA (adenine1518-N6/adenine1519-N6)-dimethyltransferase
VAKSSSTGRTSARAVALGTGRHVARKRFGQNFLVDRHYIERIVAAIDPKPADNLVEIGPGLGALTEPLLERLRHLTVIEIDRDLAATLAADHPQDRLTLHNADALEFDFAALGRDLRVVGNLPYNISSPLLFHLARYEESLRDVMVMLQREVVERMVAAPATPEYGRLSVMLQVRFRLERLFVVPPGAFRPAPKVDSAVVRLVPLREGKPRIADEALFEQVVAAAFGQRRKTLRNALRTLASEDQIRGASIDPGARGETLSVSDFVRLANLIRLSASARR